MALVPHTITALAESDEVGTDGKNIVANETYYLFDENDNPVTMYDDSSSTNPSTTKTANSKGVVSFWVEPGIYKQRLGANGDVTFTTIAGLTADAPTPTPTSENVNYNNLSDMDRPPKRSDYYQASNAAVWQYDGRLWLPSRTTVGSRASWTRLPDNVSSVFKSAGGCIGAYYTRLVNPDYTGFCLRVRNEGNGGEEDIGFDIYGGIDIEALRSSLGGQRGQVVTWYDQSGNANDFTAQTPANAPIISTYKNKYGFVSIIFERPVISGSTTTPQQYLLKDLSFSPGQTNGMSISVLTSMYHSYLTTPMVELGSGNDSISLGMSAQNGVNSMIARQNNSIRVNSDYNPEIGQSLYTAAFGSSNTKLYFNDEEYKNAQGTSLGGIAAVGARVGGQIDGFADGTNEQIYGGMIIDGFTIYSREISLLEHRNLYRSLAREFDLKPQARRGKVVFDGDSIVEGHGAEEFMGWPRATVDMTELGFAPYVVARGGATITAQLDIQANWLTNIYNSTQPYNLIVLAIGTNDLGANRTAAQIYADVQTYITNATAEGYDVVLATILPRSSFNGNSKETERLAYNDLIRNNYESIGAVDIIDWNLEGTMGNVANVGTNVYYSDGTHPTTYGYSLLATYATERLEAIIKSLVA